jgi:hypothetical protein
VSPCARCAGTAFLDTTIVTVGFDFDPVWWQIVTFFSYWYCCAAASLEFGDATATSAVAKTLATTSADANRQWCRYLLIDHSLTWTPETAAYSESNRATTALTQRSSRQMTTS